MNMIMSVAVCWQSGHCRLGQDTDQVSRLAVLEGQLGWTQGRGRLCRTDC